MASLSLSSSVDGHPTTVPTAAEVVLVGSLRNPVAADYAAYISRQDNGSVAVLDVAASQRVSALVLFLPTRLTSGDRRTLDELLGKLAGKKVGCVCVVSSFRIHLGDRSAAAAEAHVLDRVTSLAARTVVVRSGHVLSPRSRTTSNLRRLSACRSLVPARLRSCFIGGDELFAAIEAERLGGSGAKPKTVTLLGSNESWRDKLAQHQETGVGHLALRIVSALFALLLVGHVVAFLLDLLARRSPGLRHWNFDTLRPRSLRELLVLYNRHNFRHLKVVGYNNGVNHFGQRHPGKTVVSTVRCNRIIRAGREQVKADCGTTIRQALDFLAGSGQELPVVPNYSYVCLGTAFFVPIHGSAAAFSTVADTITKVLLYDPVADRLITATREDPAFREHVFYLRSPALVLRLYCRVKPKARYTMRKEEVKDARSDDLLAALRDSGATNVEVRKPQAQRDVVQIYRFYDDTATSPASALELPRDSLGRLWDRLEENAITSFLMHRLSRSLIWHVELFFSAEEFATFWETHPALPLRKIQLRYIRRDGFPHSPFRDHDCVSADMFMFRKHREQFEAYLKKTFSVVRANPGKHSA